MIKWLKGEHIKIKVRLHSLTSRPGKRVHDQVAGKGEHPIKV